MLIRFLQALFLIVAMLTLSACGFHLRGEMKLAQPLHRLYIQSADPYSYLVDRIEDYLRASNVEVAETPQQADTILTIVSDTPTQQLLSVSGTLQTRQYALGVTVIFEIQNAKGGLILGPQALVEQRVLTIQSNQILGTSNEANLFYQQMRRSLAYAIMNRIASKEVTRIVNDAFAIKPTIPT